VSGADKADGLRKVLRQARDTLRMPAQIASAGMAWYVDEAALPDDADAGQTD
jgi:6-phosphogluconolactonase/glucosamine-6-phosphate isomerase/deaminase